MAHIAGLGHVLDPKRIKRTLKSIFKHNYRTSFHEHVCAMMLVCALNDDAGLVTCTWPRGGKPETPFAYYDEVWGGIEYQVASHCIIEGLLEEGLTLVKAVRDRHDGFRRNPWDQFECCGGHHYARVMSSYGLLNALSGFTFDLGEGRIGFAPRIHESAFSCFWALDGVWGTYEQKRCTARLTVLWGAVTLRTVELPAFAGAGSVTARMGTQTINATPLDGGGVTLPAKTRLRQGDVLEIRIKARPR